MARRFMFPKIQSQALVAIPDADSREDVRDEYRQARMSELAGYYLAHAEHELRRSAQTLQSYRNSLRWIIRAIGDVAPEKIRHEHVLFIRAKCTKGGAGPARQRALIAALKSFLKFCQLTVGLQVMDVQKIRCPAMPKREVEFLSPEEVQEFVSQIPIRRSPRRFYMRGLCFRTLVEVLLGTGMRISEAISLRKSTINFETGEASII